MIAVNARCRDCNRSDLVTELRAFEHYVKKQSFALCVGCHNALVAYDEQDD